MTTRQYVTSHAHDPKVDELNAYVERAMEDPTFRAAYEDSQALHRLVDALVAARKSRNLTQTDVAARMAVRQPTVSGFENETSDPKLSTLQRYARAVGSQISFVVRSCESVSFSNSYVRSEIMANLTPSQRNSDSRHDWSY